MRSAKAEGNQVYLLTSKKLEHEAWPWDCIDETFYMVEDEEGHSYGNTINSQREVTLNGNLDLVRLYNHVPFLKKVNY